MNPSTQEADCFRQLLRNRALVLSALFVTLLCFGFAITHQSIGIDDVARNYYFYSDSAGNMIRQGRLLHVLLNSLTGAIDFIPFFTEFLGASLYCLSALLFCTLLQTVCEGKLSTFALIAFTTVYLSNSINVEKFLYELDLLAVMVSFCCCPLGLLYARRFVRGDRRAAIPAVLLTMGTISSYESFLFLYVCVVFAILILEILNHPEKWRFSDVWKTGLGFALVLVAATGAYYLLVAVLRGITGLNTAFARETAWDTSEKGFGGALSGVLLTIIRYFRNSLQARYQPIAIFCAVSGLGGLLILRLSRKRKNLWLIPCFLGMFLSNFIIQIMFRSFPPRTAQTFCFYVAFLVLLMAAWWERKPLGRAVAPIALCLLVLIQSADMNRWFFNDYVRSEKEGYVVHTLATELQSGYDLSKPVIFTNCPDHWNKDGGYLMTRLYPGADVNGNSVIYWCGNTVTGYCPTFISDLFRLYGYDFLVSPTTQLAQAAQEAAKGMPIWPQEGCIREFDDFIAVNFG